MTDGQKSYEAQLEAYNLANPFDDEIAELESAIAATKEKSAWLVDRDAISEMADEARFLDLTNQTDSALVLRDVLDSMIRKANMRYVDTLYMLAKLNGTLVDNMADESDVLTDAEFCLKERTKLPAKSLDISKMELALSALRRKAGYPDVLTTCEVMLNEVHAYFDRKCNTAALTLLNILEARAKRKFQTKDSDIQIAQIEQVRERNRSNNWIARFKSTVKTSASRGSK